ncbi:MAG TPA: DUF190 domain-containing protein [Solirubrobacteraceae bacterium]|nr:DUF190 domain-containing protein [Solirubrobacteraceae bacterium]
MSVPALKLSAYFSERDRCGRRLLGDVLLELFAEHGAAASVLLRGSDGFGRMRSAHSERSLTLSEDLPVVALALDRKERIEALADDAAALMGNGILTLERAQLLDEAITQRELEAALGEEVKLTVYFGRRERCGSVPAYRALSEALQRSGADGASALLGVDGTLHGRRSRARLVARNASVPMMLISVGGVESIAAAAATLRACLANPLMTLERVRICKREGLLLEDPDRRPERDERGRALWRKLTVYASRAARGDSRPLHRALIAALRSSGAPGATMLGGVYGFHGARPPHGERHFGIRRHAPALTIAIAPPERAGEELRLIDRITRDHGLVTSELVPVLHLPGLPGSGSAPSLPVR